MNSYRVHPRPYAGSRWTAAAIIAVLACLPASGVSAHGPAPDGHAGTASGADGAASSRTQDYDYETPRPGTYALPPLQEAPDGWVLNTAGKRERLNAVVGDKIVILSLIYTQCADGKGCPLATSTLSVLSDTTAKDPDLAANLKLVSLSFDPKKDTPEVMAGYAAAFKSVPDAEKRCDWAFLTTESEQELTPILDGYDQVVQRAPDGSFTHILQVYLIDRKRRIRNVYSVSFLDPRLLLADIRTLLMEERREGRR